jgi:hypothetical protein
MKIICEMCSEEHDHLYNADEVADIVGMVPTFDDSYNLCANCLSKIEQAAKRAWMHVVAKTESEATDGE